MTAERKHNSRRGFTLAETLVTVLILAMVSSIVAAGIPAAKRAYEKVVISANAEVLLSTSVASLRNQLALAEKVTAEEDGKSLSFYSGSGINAKIFPDAENGGNIMLQEYIGYEGGSGQETAVRPLVPEAASTEDLYVTYDQASCSGRLVTIRGLGVYRRSQAESGSGPVTSVDTLNIRVIGNRKSEDE